MERETKVVLDASVITKWFGKENDSALAIKYRDMHASGEIQIVEPSLSVYEVANALNYNPNFNESDINQSLEALLQLELEMLPPSKEMLDQTIAIARRYGSSIYDSVYLALAKTLNIKMVTADRKFWEKIKDDQGARLLALENQ